MQDLLQTLEIKVRVLLQERECFLQEKDALALKVMELQEALDCAQVSIKELREKYAQESLLASMAVEEMIAAIDDQNSAHKV